MLFEHVSCFLIYFRSLLLCWICWSIPKDISWVHNWESSCFYHVHICLSNRRDKVASCSLCMRSSNPFFFLVLWSSITAIFEILSCKSQKWGKIEFLGGILHEGQLRDPIFTVILTCPEWLDLHSWFGCLFCFGLLCFFGFFLIDWFLLVVVVMVRVLSTGINKSSFCTQHNREVLVTDRGTFIGFIPLMFIVVFLPFPNCKFGGLNSVSSKCKLFQGLNDGMAN